MDITVRGPCTQNPGSAALAHGTNSEGGQEEFLDDDLWATPPGGIPGIRG